eukprot:UN17570
MWRNQKKGKENSKRRFKSKRKSLKNWKKRIGCMKRKQKKRIFELEKKVQEQIEVIAKLEREKKMYEEKIENLSNQNVGDQIDGKTIDEEQEVPKVSVNITYKIPRIASRGTRSGYSEVVIYGSWNKHMESYTCEYQGGGVYAIDVDLPVGT